MLHAILADDAAMLTATVPLKLVVAQPLVPDQDLTRKIVWNYHVHNGRRITCTSDLHHKAAKPPCWKRTLWIHLPPYLCSHLWMRYGYTFADVCETLDCYQSYDLWHLALELGSTLSNQAVKQSFATTDYNSVGAMHNTCGGRAAVLERDLAEIGKDYPNHGGPSVLRKNRTRAANASHQNARQHGNMSPWTLAGLRDVHKQPAASSLSMTTVPPAKLKFTPPDLPCVTVDLPTFQSYIDQIKNDQKEFDLTLPDAWQSLSADNWELILKNVPQATRLLVQMIRKSPPMKFKDISVVPICRDGTTGYLLMRRVIPETTFAFHYGKPYCMFFQTIRALIHGSLYAFHLEQFWVHCPEADQGHSSALLASAQAATAASGSASSALSQSILARHGLSELALPSASASSGLLVDPLGSTESSCFKQLLASASPQEYVAAMMANNSAERKEDKAQQQPSAPGTAKKRKPGETGAVSPPAAKRKARGGSKKKARLKSRFASLSDTSQETSQSEAKQSSVTLKEMHEIQGMQDMKPVLMTSATQEAAATMKIENMMEWDTADDALSLSRMMTGGSSSSAAFGCAAVSELTRGGGLGGAVVAAAALDEPRRRRGGATVGGSGSGGGKRPRKAALGNRKANSAKRNKNKGMPQPIDPTSSDALAASALARTTSSSMVDGIL